MSDFLISQILGCGTLVLGMTAFQLKKRVYMLRCWCIAALFGAAHFFFLGAYEATALVFITACRFLVSSFTTDRRVLYLFFGLVIGGFVLTYQSPVSFLALTATLIGTWGSFQGTERAVHYAMMAAEILWVIFMIIVWSPVAIAMEVAFFTSNLIGLLRHKRATETAM